MKRILVTGAGGNASRNFIASLRMAPEPFYIVGTDLHPMHLACADVEARYVLPRFTEPEYLPTLAEIVAHEGVEMIHPQPDGEVAFLARHGTSLPVRWALPPADVIERCHDKSVCNLALAAAQVAVPRSIRVVQLDAMADIFDTLAPQGETVWVRAIRGAGSRAALPVSAPHQARAWIQYWIEHRGLVASDFMVAEYLPGREFAFQSLWHEGALVTSMARERMEYLFGNQMPSGQSSTPSVARTVHRRDVNTTAVAAVRAIAEEPHGVFCVDMKEDGEGQPCVTEINAGRFFTTSNFFSEAGCNMPEMAVRLAFGEAISAPPPFNPIPADLYWIRGVDRAPQLFKGEAWTSKRAA